MMDWSLFTGTLSIGLAAGMLFNDPTSTKDKCVLLISHIAPCFVASALPPALGESIIGISLFVLGGLSQWIYRAYINREANKVVDGKKATYLRQSHVA